MTETIQPVSALEVAAALKQASDARQSIVIRGAGTKDDWGRPAAHVDTVLDMRRLNRVLAHEHGDMTATIEAGAALRDVNAALAVHGQMLPLDPPFADRATIGGLLATNDSGPLRHRYGTPRDLVIGIQLATTHGILSKAGGQVVKNVAGYDLSKLVTGSFGSLAAIVSATFKLAPVPPASRTLRIASRDAAAVGAIVQTMMSSQLEPVAFELAVGATNGEPRMTNVVEVLIRFASLPAVVDAQIAQATAALEGWTSSIAIVDGDAERALWDAHAASIWSAPGAVVRASWLPANITAVLAEIGRITPGLPPSPTGFDEARRSSPVSSASGGGKARTTSNSQARSDARTPSTTSDVVPGIRPAFVGRAAIGAGLIRIDGDAEAQGRAIQQLRASAVFGNVVIVRGSLELKAHVDVWGSHGGRQPLFDALKRAFDPTGVLNAGRGPL